MQVWACDDYNGPTNFADAMFWASLAEHQILDDAILEKCVKSKRLRQLPRFLANCTRQSCAKDVGGNRAQTPNPYQDVPSHTHEIEPTYRE